MEERRGEGGARGLEGERVREDVVVVAVAVVVVVVVIGTFKTVMSPSVYCVRVVVIGESIPGTNR